LVGEHAVKRRENVAKTHDVTTPQLWGLPGSRAIFEQLQDALEIARRSRSVLGLVE